MIGVVVAVVLAWGGFAVSTGVFGLSAVGSAVVARGTGTPVGCCQVDVRWSDGRTERLDSSWVPEAADEPVVLREVITGKGLTRAELHPADREPAPVAAYASLGGGIVLAVLALVVGFKPNGRKSREPDRSG